MANPTKISKTAAHEMVKSKVFATGGEAIVWAAEQRAAGFTTKQTYGFNGKDIATGRKRYVHRVFVYQKGAQGNA